MFSKDRASLPTVFFNACAQHARREPLEPLEEQLRQVLQDAQRSGRPPDERRYLRDLERLARRLGQTL